MIKLYYVTKESLYIDLNKTHCLTFINAAFLFSLKCTLFRIFNSKKSFNTIPDITIKPDDT